MYCRESNPVRVASQLSRARRLFREACNRCRENPNNATRERRKDRGLAFVSVRAKLVYLLACCSECDFPTARRLGEAYQRANAQWKGEYQANIAL